MAYLSEDVETLSGRGSKELATKYQKVRTVFIQNIRTIKKILTERGVDVFAIQKEAIGLMRHIRPRVMMFKDPNYDRPKMLKFLLNDINMASNKLISTMGITDKATKILALTLYSSTAFISLVKYTEKMTVLPVNMASLLYGPIIEEVGVFLYKKDGIKLNNSNVFKTSRPVSRWLFASMYSGRMIVPLSIVSMPIITIFRTYEETFSDPKIQKFIKLSDEKSIKDVLVLFICFLLAIYIDDILPFIMKSIRLLDGLSEGK